MVERRDLSLKKREEKKHWENKKRLLKDGIGWEERADGGVSHVPKKKGV